MTWCKAWSPSFLNGKQRRKTLWALVGMAKYVAKEVAHGTEQEDVTWRGAPGTGQGGERRLSHPNGPAVGEKHSCWAGKTAPQIGYPGLNSFVAIVQYVQWLRVCTSPCAALQNTSEEDHKLFPSDEKGSYSFIPQHLLSLYILGRALV